jgi:hypothetical protein
MDSVEEMIHKALRSLPSDNDNSGLSTEAFQLLSQCTLLPRILQTYILAKKNHYYSFSLLDLHALLDISWEDLRATMCPLRHIIGCVDPDGVHRLLCLVAHHLSPETIIRQLLLELAQGCVRLLSGPVQRYWCVLFRQTGETQQTNISLGI